jgi:hypothetical protein
LFHKSNVRWYHIKPESFKQHSLECNLKLNHTTKTPTVKLQISHTKLQLLNTYK